MRKRVSFRSFGGNWPSRGRAGAGSIVAALALLCASLVRADPPPADAAPTDPLAELSDEEIAAREVFLEKRLRRNGRLAAAWQMGWASFYGAGFLVQTGRAVIAQSAAERADLVVSASKAIVGVVARVARPPREMQGMRPLLELPSATRLDRTNRLLVAEALLQKDARDSDHRFHWLGHTVNAVTNLVGGLIVWLGYHDLARAAESTAIGLAVGEVQIWTQPWQGKRAWAEYRRSYGTTATSLAQRGDRAVALSPKPRIKVTAASFGLTF